MKNKFKVGDTVYTIILQYSLSAKKMVERTVCKATIAHIHDSIDEYYYTLAEDYLTDWALESNLFATESEAQAECDRRNNAR